MLLTARPNIVPPRPLEQRTQPDGRVARRARTTEHGTLLVRVVGLHAGVGWREDEPGVLRTKHRGPKRPRLLDKRRRRAVHLTDRADADHGPDPEVHARPRRSLQHVPDEVRGVLAAAPGGDGRA